MKVYQWTCKLCSRVHQNRNKKDLLKEKELHLSVCGKANLWAHVPRRIEPVDSIEIIS